MEAEQYDEWHRLEAEARRMLDGESSTAGETLVHAAVHPSFDDSSSYKVFVPVKLGDVAARCTKRIWRRHIDSAKFESPVVRLRHAARIEATIEEFDARVPEATATPLLARMSKLMVTPRPTKSAMGVDGTTYRLVIRDGFTSGRFDWWVQPPSGWEEIGALHRDVVAMVDEALARA